MARTIGDSVDRYEDTLAVETGEDMTRVREIMGGLDQTPRTKLRVPPNPSDARVITDFQLFKKLLPEVEKNSPNIEDYAENIRRVLLVLFKREYKTEPDERDKAEIERTVQFHTQMYAIKHQTLDTDSHEGGDAAFEPTPMQQQRRNELEQYQRDFMDQQK